MNDLKQTTCKRCGRKLKNPKAIEIGMGETCWRKYQKENNHKKLWEEEQDGRNEQHINCTNKTNTQVRKGIREDVCISKHL